MKRTIIFLLSLLLLLPALKTDRGEVCPCLARGEAFAPQDSAGAMILYHAPSGELLCGHDIDKRLPMASTTKLMTALLAIERLDWEREVSVRAAWTGIEGSSIYLRAGESVTVWELLCGLLLASGNDAAVALAELCAGDTESFAAEMNARAAALGMENTHYVNPSGLPAEEHYSSARDLAILMGEAMKNPVFRRISAMESCTINGRTFQNHNRLLRECEDVIAGKTGYTKKAGRCLVSCAERNGLELICVTLSDRDDWADHKSAYAAAFAAYRAFSLEKGQVMAELPLVGGKCERCAVVSECGVSLCVPKGETILLSAKLPRFLFAPVYAADRAGTLLLSCGGVERASVPLRFRETVDRKLT